MGGCGRRSFKLGLMDPKVWGYRPQEKQSVAIEAASAQVCGQAWKPTPQGEAAAWGRSPGWARKGLRFYPRRRLWKWTLGADPVPVCVEANTLGSSCISRCA